MYFREIAVRKTPNANVESAMEWLLSHDEEEGASERPPETIESPTSSSEQEDQTASPDTAPVAKSIKCEECGKLFKSQSEVEFHSVKTGHDQFAESTEEKKPLTEEEKKEQLAKIEAKLRQRRLEREAREKQEALERERIRIKSGKEMLEAKKKHDELEIKKLVEQRKREKEEERLARQRVRDQIEQDKLARKAKFGGENVEPEKPKVQPVVAPPQKQQNYSGVQLQIRLTNGATLRQSFGPKEPLSAVKLYVELNRTDGVGPFALMMTYPRKVFGDEDYDKPLDLLGEDDWLS